MLKEFWSVSFNVFSCFDFTLLKSLFHNGRDFFRREMTPFLPRKAIYRITTMNNNSSIT